MPNDATTVDTTGQDAQGQQAQGDQQGQQGQQGTQQADGQQHSQQTQGESQAQQGQGQQDGQQQTQQGQSTEPIDYQFNAPEGVTLDEAVVTDFKDVAKELKLSQDDAQKVIDKLAPKIAQRNAEMQQAYIQEQLQKITTEWTEQAKADPELTAGGEADPAKNLEKNLATAKLAWDTYGGPELQKLLNDSGLGNHPAMIRWALKVGRTLQQDNEHVHGGGGAAPKDARSIYSNSNMNP